MGISLCWVMGISLVFSIHSSSLVFGRCASPSELSPIRQFLAHRVGRQARPIRFRDCSFLLLRRCAFRMRAVAHSPVPRSERRITARVIPVPCNWLTRVVPLPVQLVLHTYLDVSARKRSQLPPSSTAPPACASALRERSRQPRARSARTPRAANPIWPAYLLRRFSEKKVAASSVLDERPACASHDANADAGLMGRSTADVKQLTADAKQSTADAQHSTADPEQSTADAEHSTAGPKQSTADVKQSTADVKQSTADAQHSTAGVKQSTAGRQHSPTPEERRARSRISANAFSSSYR